MGCYMLNQSRLHCSPVGVVLNLGDGVSAWVSFSSLDHGEKGRKEEKSEENGRKEKEKRRESERREKTEKDKKMSRGERREEPALYGEKG
ncbi:hypothetical protein TNCV_2770821 [Trichonephila clavipes]|nr:hypothetical protein TNCV_2770821 [Trichonephila clavipes]